MLPCICDRIQHQLLLAISPLFLPSVSPLPSLSLLTPLCPFWLDSTQALYATCPSVRLYLREPQSLSLELPLLGFMRCPPFLSSLHLSNSSLFSSAPCCSLQIQTHTYTTVIASVSYFIHLNACTKEHYREWLSLTVTCGLDARYMGCVRHKLFSWTWMVENSVKPIHTCRCQTIPAMLWSLYFKLDSFLSLQTYLNCKTCILF